ncbi:sulfatase [Kiritimatiella glycovorans]|uniref:Choline-sulfatase n=1 Tax=Kiritimatiella glycovorans TaxID=1307763 RepID=A0A0G3EE34_9BACT|nr:sulfatase [Kiritimatiella glycovorans]AKJ63677.1 Choline-sulfatase [Kiritimatiella glycovorans]
MKRRSFLARGTALSALTAAGGRAASAKPGQQLNVLFIAVDDLRPELDCYGNDEVHSPHIDALAERGMRFSRAYCQFSHCAPSRQSLMSGIRPGHPNRRPHLSEWFKTNGYYAAGMGKIYHPCFAEAGPGQDMNPDTSWSEPHYYPGPRYYYTPEGIEAAEKDFAPQAKKLGVPVSEWTNHFVTALSTEAPDVDDETLYDGKIAARAIAKLRELRNRPFFLAAGFIKPHLPFVAPKRYWDLYDREAIELPDNQFYPIDAPPYAIYPRFELGQYTDTGNLDIAMQKKLIHGYRACVSFVDAQIGKLLRELDRLGLRENTVVVLWGDHGWKLGEHDAWSKLSNCELDTRTAMIVSPPGRSLGESDALVELVDLYPTLCDLCGLDKPEHLHGTSMAPLLDDPDRAWKPAAFSVMGRRNEGVAGYAMRTDRYRLVLWIEAPPRNPGPLPKSRDEITIDSVELYDHAIDPQENRNRAADPAYADVVETLIDRLLEGWDAVRAAIPAEGDAGQVKKNRNLYCPAPG